MFYFLFILEPLYCFYIVVFWYSILSTNLQNSVLVFILNVSLVLMFGLMIAILKSGLFIFWFKQLYGFLYVI